MDKQEIIIKARRHFEEDFASGYMEEITGDDAHLKKILAGLAISTGDKVLDLGTGSGYLAFPIAELHANSDVTGLDIVVDTLAANRERAVARGLNNLTFINYNGLVFPFADNTFDCAVTRYALHHFPDIDKTFAELGRVMKPHGQFFISDPTPNEDDTGRFIDTFMQMKDDGHVKFYTRDEFIELADRYGFELEAAFMSEIRFPSNRTEKYLAVAGNIDKNLIESYSIQVIEGQVYMTNRILNLSFRKK